MVRREGHLDLALVADLPVEERAARAWRVTWALPRAVASASPGSPGPAGDVRGWGGALHAPTPTDEVLTLPALLLATVPLDPSRRHVRRGPLTDAVLDAAAEAYAELALRVRAGGGDPLVLVPRGLPAGPLDAELRDRAVVALSRTPLLPAAATDTSVTDDALVEPRRAVAVAGGVGRDPRAVHPLAGWAANLVVLGPGDEAPARALGVEVRELADLVEELPAAGDPARWRALYAALEPAAADGLVREALGALPVPLADGRTVRGARGLLVGAERLASVAGGALDVLARWGVRLVHPAAAHPLLERLGAVAPDGTRAARAARRARGGARRRGRRRRVPGGRRRCRGAHARRGGAGGRGRAAAAAVVARGAGCCGPTTASRPRRPGSCCPGRGPPTCSTTGSWRRSTRGSSSGGARTS